MYVPRRHLVWVTCMWTEAATTSCLAAARPRPALQAIAQATGIEAQISLPPPSAQPMGLSFAPKAPPYAATNNARLEQFIAARTGPNAAPITDTAKQYLQVRVRRRSKVPRRERAPGEHACRNEADRRRLGKWRARLHGRFRYGHGPFMGFPHVLCFFQERFTTAPPAKPPLNNGTLIKGRTPTAAPGVILPRHIRDDPHGLAPPEVSRAASATAPLRLLGSVTAGVTRRR